MTDEVYDQMLDDAREEAYRYEDEYQARQKVDVSGMVAKARIRLEIDLTAANAMHEGRILMAEGNIEEAAEVCKKYGDYIDRLKGDLE